MTHLGNFLTANSLVSVDNSARNDMHVLSVICNDILRDEGASEPRNQEPTPQVPLDVLADGALAGLSQSALRILTNNGCRVSLTPFI
jgi:hypothetical protein